MRQNKIGILLAGLWFAGTFLLNAQQGSYWQQHVEYKMEGEVNVEDYTYSGTQQQTYTNNSPETLGRVFYHMYFNAFQPGSEMDMRLQHIEDPDRRMYVDGKSRISELKPDEVGFLKATSLKQNGTPVSFELSGTFLEVDLAEQIGPGEKTV